MTQAIQEGTRHRARADACTTIGTMLLAIAAAILSLTVSPPTRASEGAASLNTTPADPPPSMARHSQIVADAPVPGVTPFISMIPFHGTGIGNLKSVKFKILPMPGAVSQPVKVQYTMDCLLRRGYLDLTADKMTLPVFGLYSGATNQVQVTLTFKDNSWVTRGVPVTTNPYVDPNGIYDHVVKVHRRCPANC